MPNYDGLGELRFYYSVAPAGFANMVHKHTHDVMLTSIPDAGTLFTAIYVTSKDGAPDNGLADHCTAFAALIAELFHESVTIDYVELWVYDAEPSSDANYINTMTLGVAGASAAAPVPAQQTTMTFRSLDGGQCRIQLMETSLTGNTKDAYPFTNVPASAVAAYAISGSSPIIARDNAHLNVPMNLLGGQNERLFRKRYRS